MGTAAHIRDEPSGAMNRRAFTKTLFSAGISLVSLPMIGGFACASPSDQATYLTYGGYDIPDYFGQYVEKHGELPNFVTFGAVEEAFAKLSGGFVTDVVHPCLTDVPHWSATGMFQPIDVSRLSNWPDVIPELWDFPYNLKDGKPWLVPFDWGQTSIIYRTDLFELKGEESWDMMWDERYAGRLGSLAAGGETWWCAAIKAGVPFDKMGDDAAFEKISAELRKQRPLVRAYTDDTTSLVAALASGEIVAALGWNSEALELKREGIPVKFAQPKEGALTWICGMMLHANAPKLDHAYDLIDSMLSQASTEFNMREYGYGGVNRKAFAKFTDQELSELNLTRNPMEVLYSGKFAAPQTHEWERRMNKTWEQIKMGF